jgi:hypothetical protein
MWLKNSKGFVVDDIFRYSVALRYLYRAFRRSCYNTEPTECTPDIISQRIFYMFQYLKAHHQEDSCKDTGIMV